MKLIKKIDPKAKRKRLIKDLDALCRIIVFKRDKVCQKCGRSTGKLDWSHIYSRRYKQIRWNPENSMIFCAGCHIFFHQNPLEFTDFIRAKLGDRLDRLTLKRNSYFKTSVVNLELLKIKLEKEVETT